MFKVVKKVNDLMNGGQSDMSFLYDKEYLKELIRKQRDKSMKEDMVLIYGYPDSGYLTLEEKEKTYKEALEFVDTITDDFLAEEAEGLVRFDNGDLALGGRVTLKRIDCANYIDSYESMWHFFVISLIPQNENTVMLSLEEKTSR